MAIKEGSKAPDFTLATDSDEKLKLSSLKGKNVVLYFYPKSDTPGCTKFDLPFTLLADEEHAVAEMYGKKHMGVERNTFIINKMGKIAKIFAKVKPAGHAAEVLVALGEI